MEFSSRGLQECREFGLEEVGKATAVEIDRRIPARTEKGPSCDLPKESGISGGNGNI